VEDCLIFYLLDGEDDWDSWSEEEQFALSLQTLQEWICSDGFKTKASFDEVEHTTTLGKRLFECKEEDQFWKDAKYQRIKSLQIEVYKYWYDRKWATEETTRNGRPRRAEYSREVISKAMRYAYVPFHTTGGEDDAYYKSVAWSKSVLGETNVQYWITLVTIKENVFKHVFNVCGVEYFTGCTKDEISEKLKMPKRFINEMCRWLVASGDWVIVSTNRKGKRRREIRYSVL